MPTGAKTNIAREYRGTGSLETTTTEGTNGAAIKAFTLSSFVEGLQTDLVAQKTITEWADYMKDNQLSFAGTIMSSTGGTNLVRWINSYGMARYLQDTLIYNNNCVVNGAIMTVGEIAPFSAKKQVDHKSALCATDRHDSNLARQLSYHSVTWSLSLLFKRVLQGWSIPDGLNRLTIEYSKAHATVIGEEVLQSIQNRCFTDPQGYPLAKKNHPLRSTMGCSVYHNPLNEESLRATIVYSSFSREHAEVPAEVMAMLNITNRRIPMSVKSTLISLCALICMIIGSFGYEYRHSNHKARLANERIQFELNRILSKYDASHSSSDFIKAYLWPRRSMLKDLTSRSQSIPEGLTIYIHGLPAGLAQTMMAVDHETEHVGLAIPPEDDVLSYQEDIFNNWGYCYEERHRFECATSDDMTLLYSGPSNLWMTNPPIIAGMGTSHHIVILKDRFQPLYTTHVNLLASTEKLARDFASKQQQPSPIFSTMFVTQYKATNTSLKDCLEIFAGMAMLNMNILVTRIDSKDSLVRCLAKTLCTNHDYHIMDLDLHIWMTLSWPEFKVILMNNPSCQRMEGFIKYLTMDGKVKVKFGVCPDMERTNGGVGSGDNNTFGSYNTARSRFSRRDTHAEIARLITSQFHENELISTLQNMFHAIPDDGTLYYSRHIGL